MMAGLFRMRWATPVQISIRGKLTKLFAAAASDEEEKRRCSAAFSSSASDTTGECFLTGISCSNCATHRTIHLSSLDLSGHSKWSNIRHTKAKIDSERSKLINRLGNRIPYAIKFGGGSVDPKINKSLARIWQQLSANNIPKATIESLVNTAIKKTSKPVDKVLFDVKGPSGSFFIIQMLTDSAKRAENSLRKYLNKIGQFQLTDSGIRAYFEEKGVIEIAQDSSNSATLLTLEEAENLAIELSAEEVFESESQADGSKIFQFICDPMDVGSLQDALCRRGYRVTEAELELRPIATVLLSPQENQLITKLYEKLDEDDDINKVFDNLASA